MKIKLKIPKYAKEAARKALEKRKNISKSKRFGLSQSSAKKLKIRSGVSQAKLLIKKRYLNYSQAMPYYKFYQRFKSCRTTKCEGALDLWGGRRFGKMVSLFIRVQRKKL